MIRVKTIEKKMKTWQLVYKGIPEVVYNGREKRLGHQVDLAEQKYHSYGAQISP